MDREDYKIILTALELYNEPEHEKEHKEKLIKKINMFIEHDEIQTKYQDSMQELNKRMQELLSDKKEDIKEN